MSILGLHIVELQKVKLLVVFMVFSMVYCLQHVIYSISASKIRQIFMILDMSKSDDVKKETFDKADDDKIDYNDNFMLDM